MPNATLHSFSDLAQASASQARNCANEPDMRAWLKALFLEKFDGEDDRAQKAWAWCSTVGRKHMLREGSSQPFLPEQASLAGGPEWMREAVAAGKPLTALSLAREERELFLSIFDWMRSPSGPPLGSDWSKISVRQAKAAELGWIDAMAKAAAKTDLDAADAAGTTLFVALGSGEPEPQAGMAQGPEWAGWRWVEVQSADALNREGSLMRHCVGSYAKEVASGSARIYSLRDPFNAPKLTIEAKGSSLAQLKAFANSACPADLRPAVVAFAKAFDADAAARGLGAASASEELGIAGVGSLHELGLAAGSLSASQSNTLQAWIKEANGGDQAATWRLRALGPSLAGVGLAAELAMVLRFSNNLLLEAAVEAAANSGHAECLRLLLPKFDLHDKDSFALRRAAENGHAECVKLLISAYADTPTAGKSSATSLALTVAASNGRAECVKLLIPVFARKNDSMALCCAAENGHADCVSLLIPVSDPKAEHSVALRRAAENGHVECVKLLLSVCDPKAYNSHALHLAAKSGNVALVELLLPFSYPLARSDQGFIALHLAIENSRHEVVAMIERFIEEQIDGAPLPAARLDKWQAARSAQQPYRPELLP